MWTGGSIAVIEAQGIDCYPYLILSVWKNDNIMPLPLSHLALAVCETGWYDKRETNAGCGLLAVSRFMVRCGEFMSVLHHVYV